MYEYVAEVFETSYKFVYETPPNDWEIDVRALIPAKEQCYAHIGYNVFFRAHNWAAIWDDAELAFERMLSGPRVSAEWRRLENWGNEREELIDCYSRLRAAIALDDQDTMGVIGRTCSEIAYWGGYRSRAACSSGHRKAARLETELARSIGRVLAFYRAEQHRKRGLS